MVQSAQQVVFPPYRLDLADAQLWRGTEMLPLRPKTFAVLCYLIAHAGGLVTKADLVRAVWPDTYGSGDLPRGCIHELRAVLGDTVESPQFIESVGRRGYRWVAPLTNSQPVASSQLPVASQDKTRAKSSQPGTDNWELATSLVGRGAELAQLQGWLHQAQSGERQVVFVTGEPGIGKTTLVDAFLSSLNPEPRTLNPVLIGRGQCIEHYGAGEAYLPILEALGRLCREPGHERLIALLHQYAPTWLAQMPALLDASQLEMVQRRAQGATPQRMLREMA
ncbi:MAG: AAA family ATPase, partial [Candidatus Binatia bacterium]